MTPYEIPRSNIVKLTAKTALKGSFTEAVLVSLSGLSTMLLAVVISSVFSLLGSVGEYIAIPLNILYGVFITAPILLGTVRWFWRMTEGLRDPVTEIFYYFSSLREYIRVLKLTLVIGWKILTVAFLCLLPYCLVSVISGSEFYRIIGYEIPLWVPNLILIRSFLYVIGVGIAVVAISRYYLVPILVIMDERLLLLEAVHISTMVSKRSLSLFLALIVSLFFYIAASFLILPALFTLPILLSCYAVHSRYAMTNYNLALRYSEQ